MKHCNFCDRESCVRVTKIRAGFFLETFLCEKHIKEFKNYFNKFMKIFMHNIKKNEKVIFDESQIIKKINDNNIYCKSCGISAEMLFSTGFPVCKDCLSLFSEVDSIFSINDSPILENLELLNKDIDKDKTIDPKKKSQKLGEKQLNIESIIEINKKRIKRFKEKIISLIKKEDFTKCVDIRDKIAGIEKENEEFSKEPKESDKKEI